MARYTCSFAIAQSRPEARLLVERVLKACNLNTIYSSADYLVAREAPGQVGFEKLVTVEALIETDPDRSAASVLNFIIKSEELPLKSNNHCRSFSARLSQELADSVRACSTTLETLTGIVD